MKKSFTQKLWLIAAMLSVAYSASAYDVEVDGIFYNLNNGTQVASVTYGSTKYSGEVVIPSEIKVNEVKYTVISVGGNAFYKCNDLTSVTIPNSVTTIGNSAFNNCKGLTSVTIGNSVTEIGNYVFAYCTSLTSLTIPSSVSKIGESTLIVCTALSSIIVDSENKVYDSRDNCNAIIESATNKLIAGCKATTIPNTVTTIGDHAFHNCSELTSVTIPNSVREIGAYAFYYCRGLTSVTIPNSVAKIGLNAFNNCRGLTSLSIPSSVTEIDLNAFSNCTGLSSIIVDSENKVYDSRDNCNAIIESATNKLIAGCSTTTIPNTVTSIGDAAFEGCTGLTSVTIPNSVSKVGAYAFASCFGISKITIPKTVKVIGSEAFACNIKLDVYVEWDDLSDESMSFDKQPFSYAIMQSGTLHVPTGKKAIYEQTEPWKSFVNIVEYTVDSIEEIDAEGGFTIGVEGSRIVVNGAGDTKVEVFDTNGAAVYCGVADNMPELAADIYIVRVGSTIKKVAVAQ